MIDLFTIFGKGGLVLWCFQEGGQLFTDSINELIREVLMQERGGSTIFKHNNVSIKYKLDNEFELVFLVVYQSAIQLSYGDQLISDVQKKFRDMYKNVLSDNKALYSSTPKTFEHFTEQFDKIYRASRSVNLNRPEKTMRKFEESEKSKKTVASMIERPAERAAKIMKEKEQQQKAAKQQQLQQQAPLPSTKAANKQKDSSVSFTSDDESNKKETEASQVCPSSPKTGTTDDEELQRRRAEFFKKKGGVVSAAASKKGGADSDKSSTEVKKGKQARVWGLVADANKMDIASLDYSKLSDKNGADGSSEHEEDHKFIEEQRQYVGQLKGELPGLDVDQSEEENEIDDEEDDDTNEGTKSESKSGGGWFSAFKSLVGNKKLTAEDIQPALDKMRDTLIGKNVAAEPADKLCESVGVKLEGKVVGSFSRVASIVREAFRESLVQLLTPKRRVDILRDVLEAKREHRPYVIVFCGVNGVGKSTNLAKITFWLNENGYRVLIAAGDTFRAGAVEQLRTHTKHLNSLHPNSVQLYEQGYGKDPAGLAAAAIAIAVERSIDVVLVDTAGRMQDNEPLMRSLAKLIHINEPDLVLFVGEALVGNDAVDQLVKFNQALADHAALGADARLIDGIVLTKFDTIDDKVGAAISMTYITGQPIVFVGTGQTYNDLKNLNANAVVHSLLK